MIPPNDQDLIISMVGTEYGQNPPKDFVLEYGVRLGMLSRAGGAPNGIGVVSMMQLLREFDVAPHKKPVIVEVSDWTKVGVGTPVLYQGRRGVYKGSSGEGMILVSLDGYKAMIEVSKKEVTLTKPLVESVNDKVFDKDPDDVTPPRAALLDKEGDAKEQDILLDEWGGLEAGSEVMAVWRGKEVKGEFVDIEGDNDVVVLINGTKRKLDASKVTVQAQV